jgi:hypothetical protein
MKKLDLARFVTTVLYNRDELVSADHWKVKDLMKMRKDDLEDFHAMAVKANRFKKLMK